MSRIGRGLPISCQLFSCLLLMTSAQGHIQALHRFCWQQIIGLKIIINVLCKCGLSDGLDQLIFGQLIYMAGQAIMLNLHGALGVGCLLGKCVVIWAKPWSCVFYLFKLLIFSKGTWMMQLDCWKDLPIMQVPSSNTITQRFYPKGRNLINLLLLEGACI